MVLIIQRLGFPSKVFSFVSHSISFLRHWRLFSFYTATASKQSSGMYSYAPVTSSDDRGHLVDTELAGLLLLCHCRVLAMCSKRRSCCLRLQTRPFRQGALGFATDHLTSGSIYHIDVEFRVIPSRQIKERLELQLFNDPCLYALWKTKQLHHRAVEQYPQFTLWQPGKFGW